MKYNTQCPLRNCMFALWTTVWAKWNQSSAVATFFHSIVRGFLTNFKPY